MSTRENQVEVCWQNSIMVRTLGALFVALLLIAEMCRGQHVLTWRDLGRNSLHACMKIDLRAWQSASNEVSYEVAYVADKQGRHLFVRPGDNEMTVRKHGTIGYELTAATKALARIMADVAPLQCNDAQLCIRLARLIYQDREENTTSPFRSERLVQRHVQRAEIDRRARGTELESLTNPSTLAQRTGVLASLNLFADALKLLPEKYESKAPSAKCRGPGSAVSGCSSHSCRKRA